MIPVRCAPASVLAGDRLERPLRPHRTRPAVEDAGVVAVLPLRHRFLERVEPVLGRELEQRAVRRLLGRLVPRRGHQRGGELVVPGVLRDPRTEVDAVAVQVDVVLVHPPDPREAVRVDRVHEHDREVVGDGRTLAQPLGLAHRAREALDAVRARDHEQAGRRVRASRRSRRRSRATPPPGRPAGGRGARPGCPRHAPRRGTGLGLPCSPAPDASGLPRSAGGDRGGVAAGAQDGARRRAGRLVVRDGLDAVDEDVLDALGGGRSVAPRCPGGRRRASPPRHRSSRGRRRRRRRAHRPRAGRGPAARTAARADP